MTAIASNYWLAIPIVFLAIIFFSLRQYFLKTAREVKRLEAIGKDDNYDCGLSRISSLDERSSESCVFTFLHDSSRSLHSQGHEEGEHSTTVLPQVPE